MKVVTYRVTNKHPELKEDLIISKRDRGLWSLNGKGHPFLYASHIINKWVKKGFIEEHRGFEYTVEILNIIAEKENVLLFNVFNDASHKAAEIRQIAAYVIREKTKMSFTKITECIPCYKRQGTFDAYNKIKARIEVDKKLAERVNAILKVC